MYNEMVIEWLGKKVMGEMWNDRDKMLKGTW